MAVILWLSLKTIVIYYYLYAQPLFLIYHSPNMEPPERFLRRFEKDNVTHIFLRAHVMCSRGLVSKPQGEPG